jgi:ATP-binding cassette, subfamily B, bacterial PglK
MGAMTATRFASAQVTAIHEDLEHLAQRKQISPQHASGPEVPFENTIQIEALRFKYPSAATRVLDGIDLTIERGQHIAFVGSSGAGKTTIVDLILGLLTPESGRILVDGRDIAQNVRSWQRQIGYIAQPVHLIDDTVRRNIAYGVEPSKVDEARVWAALREARLEEFVRSKPEGLDATIGEDGVRVSGGQRQRIGIARALYHQPSVLILDEATSALDNQTEREFMQEMKAFRHSKTIITIAHRLSTIMDADRIFFLSGGKLVASGTFDELVAANADFARMARTAESDAEPIPPRP